MERVGLGDVVVVDVEVLFAERVGCGGLVNPIVGAGGAGIPFAAECVFVEGVEEERVFYLMEPL